MLTNNNFLCYNKQKLKENFMKKNSFIKKIEKSNPKLYEFIKLLIAIISLTVIFTPAYMYGSTTNMKASNIHSQRQIDALMKLKEIKTKDVKLYRVLQDKHDVNIDYCVEVLEGLDLKNNQYYECKKIGNAVNEDLKKIKEMF